MNVKKLFKYKRLLNFYPPFLGAGIKLKEFNKKGTSYLVEMKLRWYNRNVYGTHFGGSLYAMCDPFFVFAAYSFFGDDYVIWDKSASISFKRPGKGTVTALFHIPDDRLEEMKKIVDSEGKKTFHFIAEVKDKGDNIVATVEKEIYIRKK
jgi:acyl-coenzyme A thioesterase PaaI-like protein